jgi:hypothetical protein
MAWNRMIHKRCRAVVIVEAAIAFFLLLLLVLGVIELGWAILKSQQVTNAARQGARVGARIDATSDDVVAAVHAALAAAGMPEIDPVLEPPDVSSIPGGAHFTVTLTVPYASVGLGVLPLQWNGAPSGVPTQLVAHVTMAKEGYNPPP